MFSWLVNFNFNFLRFAFWALLYMLSAANELKEVANDIIFGAGSKGMSQAL